MIVWLLFAVALAVLLIACVLAIGLGCLLVAANADRISRRDEG